MKLKAKSHAGGGETVKPKTESGVSPELERELLRLSKEAKEDIAAGRYRTYEEHVKWVENLDL